MSTLEFYVGICRQRQAGQARHWMLVAVAPGADICTWYHADGGPTQNKPYTLKIQNKRFNSHGVESYNKVADIKAKDINKVKSSAQKITPKYRQRWAVDVLGDLERKSLVPAGTSQAWFNQMEVDPYSSDGAQGGSSSNAGGSSSTSTRGANYTSSYQSSGAGSSQASASQATPEWVWDEQARRYRYWDPINKKWVWQQ
ncbi:uncharacterized protein F4807DRAFT_463294 [Annulohypoxylon truncatum]|uniref:uncharacterized protein n=1 Tax=Annulohypoxylon truncatum TaxID=327061 RepID=UPI002007A84E|nr:uncharacterized protein F4807DRAFT_463294 [Annulohypoxylon truncatum]KAI1206896.1 hypothetical protein F4807DRAFT_463294 [Annulohypoxylon truncatum]